MTLVHLLPASRTIGPHHRITSLALVNILRISNQFLQIRHLPLICSSVNHLPSYETLLPLFVILRHHSCTLSRMTSKLIAIVAGVGPGMYPRSMRRESDTLADADPRPAGTGASVARKFAATYPVVLLARNPENFEGLAKEINSSGGKAIGISTDISDSNSIKNAVENIKKEFGADVGAAV
jgi:hypothetical protein